jgi:hypothetical protein
VTPKDSPEGLEVGEALAPQQPEVAVLAVAAEVVAAVVVAVEAAVAVAVVAALAAASPANATI